MSRCSSECKRFRTGQFLNVIVASIHASEDGSFSSSTDNLFTENYETEAGNEYVRGSEMPGMFGNPMGTINRKWRVTLHSVWYFSKLSGKME